jgi:hypothetical protein
MSEQEFRALLEILQRAPMSQAERLFLAGLVERVLAQFAQNEKAAV